MVSKSTIYLIDSRAISALNLELPRKVKFRQQKKSFKVDKSCRIVRTYHGFLSFMNRQTNFSITQFDSVEG